MTQEELVEYFNKLPEAMKAYNEHVNSLLFYLVHITNFVVKENLYEKFCNELEEMEKSKAGTIQ